jgi:hypothetical protein
VASLPHVRAETCTDDYDSPMTVYRCNGSFDGYREGEFVEADERMVADWLDAGYLSEVTDEGARRFAVRATEDAARPLRDLGGVTERVTTFHVERPDDDEAEA